MHPSTDREGDFTTINQLPLGAVLYMGSLGGNAKKGFYQWVKVSRDNDFFSLVQVTTDSFDRPEIYSPGRARREGGNNFYPFSNIHQWLNKNDASPMQPMHDFDDVCPFATPGFLTHFSSVELANLVEREYVVSVPPGSVKEHGKSVVIKSLVTLPAASELFENFINDTVNVSEGEYLPELRRNTRSYYSLLTRTGANSPASVVYSENGGIRFSKAKKYYQIYPMVRVNGDAKIVLSSEDNVRRYYEFVIPETPEDKAWAEQLTSILGF